MSLWQPMKHGFRLFVSAAGLIRTRILFVFSVISTITQGDKPLLTGERVLVVCHTQSDLPRLDEYSDISAEHVRVASDEIAVQRAAASREWVDDTCYIEQMEPFVNVAEDVMETVGAINEWISSISNGVDQIDAECLYWRKSPEGGRTQSIQDALLLIRMFESLLSTDVNRLVLLRKRETVWEDDLLVRTAREMGLTVTEDTPLSVSFEQRLRLRWHRISRSGIDIVVPVPEWIRFRFLQIRLVVRIVRAHVRGFSPPNTATPQIVFQLAAASEKHLEGVRGPMRAFDRVNDYDAVALCWGVRDAARTLHEEGLQAVELEQWAPLWGLLTAYRQSRAILATGLDGKPALEQHEDLSYHGVDITPSIWSEMTDFLQYRMFARIAMRDAMERYLSDQSPRAIKIWSGGTHEYGRVARVLARRRSDPDPLLFYYSLGILRYTPYFHDFADLYLVSGQYAKRNLIEQGVDPDDIVVTGHGRFDSLVRFRDAHTVVDSKDALSISHDRSLCIFYAPQNEMRGFYWKQENLRVTTTLVKFAEKHPEITLIIKPHPSGDPEIFESAMIDHSTDNVTLVDQSRSPYHCLNASDAVITKYSTVGFEAMLFETVLVSIALDAPNIYEGTYGDVAEEFGDVNKMTSFLNQLINDYKSIASEQRSDRQSFLETELDLNDHASESIIEAVVTALSTDQINQEDFN